jgi:hypothetical protein
MSDPQNFLTRWSRRKREAARSGQAVEPPPEQTKPDEAKEVERQQAQLARTPQPEETPDLSALPSVESIAADTDIRGFLQPGVPEELTRAALRRAWSSDPAIRDFVGLVENGWDFNDPSAAAGFGPLSPGEASRLLAQAVDMLSTDRSVEALENREKPPAQSAPSRPDIEGSRAPQHISGDAAPQKKKEEG